MPYIGLVLMINLFDISDSGNYSQKEKRSVFEMIENIRKDGKENTNEDPTTYAAVQALDTEKAIKYEELRKMLLIDKRKQGTRVKRYQIRREELKRKFLKEFKRRQEDMLTKFSFLTKLS